ncbi:MAG: hypothetical protein K2F91_00800 [Muribaculaceae bacterium]|nr:hypothetical protein [Muribaculaceae bacterium]MDE6196387.1 hypothetical protein [Muribaculaceae bacterium]
MIPARKIAAILTLGMLWVSAGMAAQNNAPLNDIDREKALCEMKAYKHDVLAKELDLTKEQQRDFFPIYDELDSKLLQINLETRELERRTEADAEASDTELEAAAAAIYAQKQKEGKLEMEYYDKFRELLTPRQLLRLRSAEKKFTRTLVRHHRRLRER